MNASCEELSQVPIGFQYNYEILIANGVSAQISQNKINALLLCISDYQEWRITI